MRNSRSLGSIRNRKTVIIPADKMTVHFDQDWKLNRSTLRAKTADDRSYNPDSSWDAKSDNPIQFSRLQETGMPVQNAKPVTLSGAAVIELEKKTDGLKILNGYQQSKKHTDIPLNTEQLDIKLKKDLSCISHMEEIAKENEKHIVMDALPSFNRMGNKGPVFKEVEIPHALIASGPQCDQCLLNPTQRREIANYEQKKKFATLYIKDAKMSREKTKKLVNGPAFHRGILQVDDSLNVDSEIYGDRAREYHNKHQAKYELKYLRHERLAKLRSNMSESGNILNGTSIKVENGIKINKEFQSKCMKNTQLPTSETHIRIFPAKLKKYPRDEVREQKLRNQDICGKNFNMVSHTKFEHYNTDVNERINTRQIHPSNDPLIQVPKIDFKQFLHHK